jgi:ASPIC/UnbV protein/VCBS repeat protein
MRFSILLPVIASLVLSTLALADIQFEEVSAKAGILHSGVTQGVSWGDFNSDGWPDVWVGNHYELPSLYVNQRDGTFVDVIASVWSGDPHADMHGAAWADFDNDGDQDLLVLVGAVMGRGSGGNLLFVNRDGRLEDQAQQWGLDYPLGRGRTPLWFDFDGDGRLDVLLMTAARPDGKAPSAVFRQSSNRFEQHSQPSTFSNSQPSLWQQIGDLLQNLAQRDFSVPSRIGGHGFAQLADVSGDGALDVVVFTNPIRLFSLTAVPFEDFTHRIAFPSGSTTFHGARCWWCSLKLFHLISGVWDAAIEDFDGDGHLDMYLARPQRPQSEVVQITPIEIRGTFAESHGTGDTKTLNFHTGSYVTFQLNVPWEGPSNPFAKPLDVAIGSGHKHITTEPFTLAPDDATIGGSVPVQATMVKEVSIVYNPATSMWTLSSSGRQLNFILRAGEAIDQVRGAGLTPVSSQRSDLLLLRRGDRFVRKKLPDLSADEGGCHSVAAGDFDNDMDIDIYLVCTGQVTNHTNRLLENDGVGNFRDVADAGGASGSKLGRGDAVVMADYNRDGFLDLFVTNGFGPPPFADEGPHQLFRNRGNGNHWLEIDLEGTLSNRDGIGASVTLEAGGVVQMRGQGGGTHQNSQHHQRLHFGLGKHTAVDWLTIRWPSGIIQHLEHVATDYILTIRETGQ